MFYNFRKNKKAFTLVELIVVIAILAVLGTVAGVATTSILKKSKKSACQSNLDTLEKSVIEVWKADGNSDGTKIAVYIAEVFNDAKNVYVKSSEGDVTDVNGSFHLIYKGDGFLGKLSYENGSIVKREVSEGNSTSGYVKVTTVS